MKKLYILGLVTLAGIIIGLAWADQMTFTTYYPAPYGVYNDMVVMNSLGVGTTDPGTARVAVIGGNVGIGTTQPLCKLDVNGENYLTELPMSSLNPTVFAEYKSSDYGAAVVGLASSSSGNVDGLYGVTTSSEHSAAGVIGWATGLSGTTEGVSGIVSSNTEGAKAIRGSALSDNAWSGYFAGGKGIYVDGNIKRTGTCSADYVFEPNYNLETIEEHAKFMWENKCLSAIPRPEKTEDGKYTIEIGEQQTGLLEELEKAHIYIAQLKELLDKQEQRIASLETEVIKK